MANVLGELFGDIAGAIREKTGQTGSMKPAQFPDKIRSIEAGPGEETIINGVDPYYQQLAEALMTRKAEYLGDRGALNLKGFKTSDGATLGSLNSYSFAGFSDVESIVLSDTIMIYPYAFCDDSKLKLIDLTLPPGATSATFWGASLTGCTALETVIIRDGGVGVNMALFLRISMDLTDYGSVGANDTFFVYVPSERYDEVVAEATSNKNSVVPADRYRKLEDYPAIDHWNETFTVRFYDGDTLVDTKTVQYGKAATSSYKKDGYQLVSWTPEPSGVTENMDCYGRWAPANFEDASWEEIHALTEENLIGKVYSVGDTKSEVLTYSDGSTEEITWEIAKIRDNGTVVLAFKYALETIKQMNSSITSCAASYFNNDLGKYITNTIVPALSAEFTAVIRPAYALFSDRQLRLPTVANLQGTATSTSPEYEGLPLFAKQANRIRTRKKDGLAVTYWTGSYSKPSSYYYFNHVDTAGNIVNGSSGANGITDTRGIVLLADV